MSITPKPGDVGWKWLDGDVTILSHPDDYGRVAVEYEHKGRRSVSAPLVADLTPPRPTLEEVLSAAYVDGYLVADVADVAKAIRAAFPEAGL